MLRLGLGEQGPALGAGRRDDRPGDLAGAGGIRVAGRQVRGLVQRLEVVVLPPHAIEHAGGRVGIGERGDAGAVEDVLAGPDRVAAHPARQHRLAGDVGVLRELLGGRVGSVIACGVRMTSSPSVPMSLAAISSVWA